MKRLVAVALVWAFTGTVALAYADDKANPTGTWTWSMAAGGGGTPRTQTLKLKLDGDKLTGAMIGRNNAETAIEDAKFKDGEISFSITRDRNGTKTTTKYTGKVSGDTIKGKIEPPGGGASRDWEAKRSKDTDKTDK